MSRVLHVISGLGTGGAESFLAQIAPRLAAKGFAQEVVSLTGDGPIAERIEGEGIAVTRLDVRGLTRLPSAIGQLVRRVVQFEPSVLQGWMYHGDFAAMLAHRLARRHERRLFWNVRCSDMRLEDYARQLRAVVRMCAATSHIPDVVIANSQAGADVHKAAGYRPRRLLVIPNGVDCQRFAPRPDERAATRAALGIPSDAQVLVHVARVDPMKDHATLMAAMETVSARHPLARLVLVGLGTEAMARPPGILGLGQRSDVDRLLAAGDIIVSSSAYGEGFSNAIAEGMAAGLAPVATAVGDAAAILGGNGHVVPPGDPGRLADGVDHLLALSRHELAAAGVAARERIVENFAIERAVERFAALYRGEA